MKVVQLLMTTVKNVLVCLTPNRSLSEGLFKYDFKLGEPRLNLMQICFSPVAHLWLWVLLFLIWVDPSKYAWSLQNIFGNESRVRFFLLDGQLVPMLIVTTIFLSLQFAIRIEYLWISAVFYFLGKSELHLHLALAALIGIFNARAIYTCLKARVLESRTRNIFGWVSGLQLMATLLFSVLSLLMLDHYQQDRYFSDSLSVNRFGFLLIVIAGFQFFILAATATWGHLYFQRTVEPSSVPIYFSTARLLGAKSLRSRLRQDLWEKSLAEIEIHKRSLAQVREMKDQGLGLRMLSFENILTKELGYLETAASRLTAR